MLGVGHLYFSPATSLTKMRFQPHSMGRSVVLVPSPSTACCVLTSFLSGDRQVASRQIPQHEKDAWCLPWLVHGVIKLRDYPPLGPKSECFA